MSYYALNIPSKDDGNVNALDLGEFSIVIYFCVAPSVGGGSTTHTHGHDVIRISISLWFFCFSIAQSKSSFFDAQLCTLVLLYLFITFCYGAAADKRTNYDDSFLANRTTKNNLLHTPTNKTTATVLSLREPF